MGLLDRLKAALGLGSGSDGSERAGGSDRDGGVRVEHEPETDTEAAVKGTEDESVAAGTDAAGSTGSITETPPETPGDDDDVAEAAEPAEAAGPVGQTDGVAGDEEAGDEEADAEDDGATGEDAASTGDGRPVREISGIGPAYERRLNDAGIETVGDLAAADAAELAEATDVAEGRVENWIDRAGDTDG